MILLLGASAHADPLHADKRIYDLGVEVGAGAQPAPGVGDWGVGRGALVGRLTDHVVADVDVAPLPRAAFGTETGEIDRALALRAGGGVSWSIGGTGLHGVQLGARAMLGRARYTWLGDTRCTTIGGGTYSGTCPTLPSPALPRDGLRVDLQPHVGARWVGHPGLVIGAEVGLNVSTGALVEREARVGPYGFVTAGWVAPLGDPWTTRREALSRLSPEDARRRRAQNKGVAITVASLAGATALGLGGTALWLATHPVLLE